VVAEDFIHNIADAEFVFSPEKKGSCPVPVAPSNNSALSFPPPGIPGTAEYPPNIVRGWLFPLASGQGLDAGAVCQYASGLRDISSVE
jgi:hypothetical protein